MCVLIEKGYICTPHVLALITEVAQGCLSHKAEGEEDQLSLTIRILTNIFQKIVEIIAHRLRKDKEEGQEVRPLITDVKVFLKHFHLWVFLDVFNKPVCACAYLN